jgi:hypothetical protein
MLTVKIIENPGIVRHRGEDLSDLISQGKTFDSTLNTINGMGWAIDFDHQSLFLREKYEELTHLHERTTEFKVSDQATAGLVYRSGSWGICGGGI